MLRLLEAYITFKAASDTIAVSEVTYKSDYIIVCQFLKAGVETQGMKNDHDISNALLAAMIFPGAGQFYNGQSAKSTFLVLLTFLVLAGILRATKGYVPALLVMGALLWFVAMLDAAAVANRIIRGEKVRAWKWF